jgi:hypothetical protein
MKTNPLAIEGQPGALKGHHGAVQSHLEQWRAKSMWEFLLEPCGGSSWSRVAQSNDTVLSSYGAMEAFPEPGSLFIKQ